MVRLTPRCARRLIRPLSIRRRWHQNKSRLSLPVSGSHGCSWTYLFNDKVQYTDSCFKGKALSLFNKPCHGALLAKSYAHLRSFLWQQCYGFGSMPSQFDEMYLRPKWWFRKIFGGFDSEKADFVRYWFEVCRSSAPEPWDLRWRLDFASYEWAWTYFCSPGVGEYLSTEFVEMVTVICPFDEIQSFAWKKYVFTRLPVKNKTR